MADNGDGQERPVEDLPSAVQAYDEVLDRIGQRKPALFLDFDGTLTPIVSRPDLVALNSEARDIIESLVRRLPVAVVSGRERAEVESLVAVDGLSYAGAHGFDIRTADGRRHQQQVDGAFTEALERTEATLRRTVDAIDGALMERKRRSIALHYRLVDAPDLPRFHDAVDAALTAEPCLKPMHGKKVVELEPDIDWNKGRAVQWLLTSLGLDGPDIVPIFIGDDVTDEYAFAAILPDGIGIVVADPRGEPGRQTHASFRVDGPEAVVETLRRLDAGDWP